MKTKCITAQELFRGMIFKMFGQKYIIANVNECRQRRGRRYSSYNQEVDCRINDFTEVEFFMTGQHVDIQMQHMVVSNDFEFHVITKGRTK